MATGKRINIAASGFPGTNKTWRFIQEAFAEPLGALAQLAGNFTIVSGMEPSFSVSPMGVSYSNGFVSINGEILPFIGGDQQAQCTIIETVENATYDVDLNNDSMLDSLPTYITRYVTFGSGGVSTFNFAQLKRLKTIDELSAFSLPAGIVIDPNYIAFTSTLLEKLNSIQFGAQVNVKANWNAPEGAPNEILNKPRFTRTLWKGDIVVQDVYPDTIYAVNFFQNVGTIQYFPLISFETMGASDQQRKNAATIFHAWYGRTQTGFLLRLGEKDNINQGTLRVHIEVKTNSY
jgi:hypothetical protein